MTFDSGEPKAYSSKMRSVQSYYYVVGLTVVLLPTPARADSYDCGGGYEIPDLHPADGSGRVPTNAKLWFANEAELRASDGSLVPLQSYEVAPGVDVRVPDQRLKPLEHYRFGSDRSASAFTVGTSPDDKPPDKPEVMLNEVHHHIFNGRESKRAHWATLDVFLDSDAVLLVVDLNGGSTLDPETLSGQASLGFDARNTEIRLGSEPCGGDGNVPGAKRGTKITARYGAFDVAGNFSGWTEEESFRLRAGGGCGCSTHREGASSWTLLLGGFVLTWLHRSVARQRVRIAGTSTHD